MFFLLSVRISLLCRAITYAFFLFKQIDVEHTITGGEMKVIALYECQNPQKCNSVVTRSL